MKKLLALGTVLTIACVQTVQAAFIVEPIAGGLAYNHYAYLPAGGVASVTALGGTAPGLSGINSSIYGGNGATDTYRFSYTPGTDVDNWSPAAGLTLGDNYLVDNYATGVIGGGSGRYNVYATWIVSSNITGGGTTFNVTSDGPLVTSPLINQNTGMTGNGVLNGTGGGNVGWFYLGTVALTAGNTYTVSMAPVTSTFTSMRSAGVMWEMVPVPEPSTLALSIVGGLFLLGHISRRRNR